MMDDRHLMAETTDADGTGEANAAPRTTGVRPILLALLACLLAGNSMAQHEDPTTMMADRHLMAETTEAGGTGEANAAPRTALAGSPALLLAALLGLGVRR